MSRITNNMIINNFLANFTRSQKSLNKYMEQLTTGENSAVFQMNRFMQSKP